MCTWLLTNTTYGTWLPGDARWSYTDTSGQTELTSPKPGLAQHARGLLKGEPILLKMPQAELVLAQFQETATYRGWNLLSVAIMANHFHLVVHVTDDHQPRKILADFKAYAARKLNRHFDRPASGKWWTRNGSKRKLPDAKAVAAAVHYVLNKQPAPLVTWSPSP